MSILAIDPSGNFEEGRGITGFCLRDDDNDALPMLVSAEDYRTAMEYYEGIIDVIYTWSPDVVVVEGYRLYNHKGMSAKSQSNSILETPQLIGIIRYHCYTKDIPIYIQYAVQVKNRWSDEVLLESGLLIKKGNRFYLPNDKIITNHARDAYRHLLHYKKYGGAE